MKPIHWALGLVALTLSGCISPVMLRDPATSQITQCLATGPFPIIDQQQCISSYENLGWVRMTAEEQQAVRQQAGTIAIQQQTDAAQCVSDMQSAELDPIRQKVELTRDNIDNPPPFEIASNDTFPTSVERPVIAKWATIRDACIKRANAASAIPSSTTPIQTAYSQQDRSFGTEATARVSELVLSLYQGKLTYGEFAQKRYEISRDAAAAERQFRASTLIADHDRQMQAQQNAQQQFQNNLLAWSTYVQAVNARQPQTVHIDGGVRVKTNCTSTRLGTVIDTTCN